MIDRTDILRKSIMELADCLLEWQLDLPSMPTDVLVESFDALDALTKALKSFESTFKNQLKSRISEAQGTDAKGHRYLMTSSGKHAVKFERRLSIKLRDNAIEVLKSHGLLELFSKAPDPNLMLNKLREIGIPDDEFSSPQVDVKSLEEFVESGLISSDIAVELLDIRETWVIKRGTITPLEKDQDTP